MHTFRHPGILLAALIAAGGLAGCGGSEDHSEASVRDVALEPGGATAAPETVTATPGEPCPGDWIVVHFEAEPATLNPYLTSASAYTKLVVDGYGGNIFESLLVRDRKTLEMQPHIAERWEVSGDHLTYTFYLRKDVKFSDGVPLTARDVEFTYQAILTPANDTADTRSYFNDFESCTVVDDYTIQFKVKRPYFMHLILFSEGWFSVLPKHIYSEGDFNTIASRAPVGSGPYRFVKWDTGQQIVLVKRDDYWGPKKPWVNELHFKIVTDDNATMTLLKREEIDVARLTSEQWVRQASQPAITDHFNKFMLYSPAEGYAASFGWIGWNMKRPYFQDKRVRQAMTMLLDRETIKETILYGFGRVVTGDMFPDSPDYDKSIQPWPFDPEAAKKKLDEAGWIDSDKDGVRDRDGTPFRFEFLMPTGSQVVERMITFYQEELKKAGIDMVIRPLEWTTFQESVIKRTFDACTMSWVSEAESDPYQLWHSSQQVQGSNYVGLDKPEVDKLLEDARLIFDREERAKLYRHLHAILHEEQPYTFLYNAERKVVISKRFRGVEAYTLGFDKRDWWVPLDEQRYK